MSKTAIEGKRGTTFWQHPEDLVIIGLDTPDGPGHHLYDDRINLPLDELKIEGVMDNGVDTPVHVIKDGERLLVVDGRQRVRWAREANKRLALPIQIEVQLKRGDELDHARRMIRTNEHRETDSPYVKAKKAQRLLDRGLSMAQAAKEFAVSTQALGQWLKLLETAPAVQQALASGEMTASEALKLKDASHDIQAAVAATDPAERKAAVKAAAPAPKKRGRPNLARLQQLAGDVKPFVTVEARDFLMFVVGDRTEEEMSRIYGWWPKPAETED